MPPAAKRKAANRPEGKPTKKPCSTGTRKPTHWNAKDVIRQYQQRNDPESREIAAVEEKLAPEQEIVVRTRFTAGKTYNITGRCDPECDNMYLDLYRNVYLDLYDEETRHGLRVKNDLRVLKSPGFSWTAEKDEDYTAVLTMKKCTKKTCAAALQIFEGNKAFW